MSLYKDHPFVIDQNEHARNILQKLDSMRREQKNCDLVISVQGKKFHVNRDVMCAASDYFDAMFSHDTKEKQNAFVEMKDVQYHAVKKCIDFIYTGRIAVSEDQCDALLFTSVLMQLHAVQDIVCHFLQRRLNPKTFFHTRKIAVKFSLKSIIALCDKFALDHLLSLSKEKEFCELDLYYVTFLISSLKSMDLRTEDCKLAIALKWINFDLNCREKHLQEMLQFIDMSGITLEYTKFLVEEEPLSRRSVEFLRELLIGLTSAPEIVTAGPPDFQEVSSLSTESSANCLIMFDESSKMIQVYSPLNDILHPAAAYHQKMTTFFTTCIFREYLYVFTTGKAVLRTKITDENPVWRELDDMLFDHGLRLQCTIQGSTIYVGGESKLEKCNMEATGKWESVDLDGNLCDSSALVHCRGSIFVIGGRKGLDSVNIVTKYTSATTAWMPVKPMNISRQNASATVFDGTIYVAGGNDINEFTDQVSNHVESYDETSDSWTVLAQMKTPRSWFRLCVIEDQIFAVGNGSSKCSMEVFDFWALDWYDYENGPKMLIWAPATIAAYLS